MKNDWEKYKVEKNKSYERKIEERENFEKKEGKGLNKKIR